MIFDTINSFTSNIKEKISNPFLGTYLLVWFVRNWDLVYTIFNFDADCDLNYKVTFIKAYYSHNNFLLNLAENILWAFALLVVTYILINISRAIVNIFEKKLTPWIYKKTDSSSIVLKSTYDDLSLERYDLQTRLEQERESKARLEGRIKNLETENLKIHSEKGEEIKKKIDLQEKLEFESERVTYLEKKINEEEPKNLNNVKKINELNKKIAEDNVVIKQLKDEIHDNALKIEILKTELNKKSNVETTLNNEISYRMKLENDLKEYKSNPSNKENLNFFINGNDLVSFRELEKKNMLQDYYSTYLQIMKGEVWLLAKSENLNFYLKLGLVDLSKEPSESVYKNRNYIITPKGEVIAKYLNTLGYNF